MSTRIILLVFFTSILGCVQQTRISSNPKASNSIIFDSLNSIGEKLSQELAREYTAGTFEGTLIVISNEQEILNESYGWANKEQQINNTGDSISDMGSIAKTFTALAILQLVANKNLSLNTTLESIFPFLPEDKKPITIEQLLSHTSGMDNFHNESDFDVMSKDEAVHKILAMPLIAEPNEKIVYSNAAYTLLAAVVEKMSQHSFQQYVRKNILEPLSLNDTGFYGDAHIDKKRVAIGYGGTDSGSTTFEKQLTWALIGAGGMVTSANDMLKWQKALYQGSGLPKNTENLSLLTVNEKWKLGNIRYFESWGTLIFYMGGSTDYGYTSAALHLPEYDVDIIMMLNSYGDKYEQSTHQKLNKNHIVPILLQGSNVLKRSKKTFQ